FNVKTPQKLWSVSKSISSILIGIAQKQGLLNIKDKVKMFYPHADERLEISHLLHMSSGLFWNETYENNPLDSDVLNMLFIKGHKDMASYVAMKKQEFAPGSHFKYSSGETNFMMSLLQKKISRLDYDTFPWKKLFTPLGITTATWERDHAGNFIGSSYLYLSPEDLARIGQLFLNGGVWGDQEIVS